MAFVNNRLQHLPSIIFCSLIEDSLKILTKRDNHSLQNMNWIRFIISQTVIHQNLEVPDRLFHKMLHSFFTSTLSLITAAEKYVAFILTK